MTEQTLASMPPSKRRVNQLKLIGIFAIAGVPVILAMLMYFGSFAVPSGKTNKGELLLPPLSLNQFGFQSDAQGIYPDLDGKWMLFVSSNGAEACLKECQALVYMARQVNVLLAKESDRLSRVLMTAHQAKDSAQLSQEYPRLEFVKQKSLSAPEGEHSWNLWVSDPLGNVILRYDSANTGYDLKDDLKKLLKLSNIG